MIEVRCSRCGSVRRVERVEELKTFPFCSERCKLIDLGEWLTERHCIPGRELSPDEDEKKST